MFIVQWHNQKHDPPWEAALETVRKRGGGGLLERDGRRMRSRASGLLGPRQTLELTDVG